eukprot:923157-Rhodomonas_salina.3
MSGTVLRACYAVPGTDVASDARYQGANRGVHTTAGRTPPSGATRSLCDVRRCYYQVDADPSQRPMQIVPHYMKYQVAVCLRACYVMSGIEQAYC